MAVHTTSHSILLIWFLEVNISNVSSPNKYKNGIFNIFILLLFSLDIRFSQFKRKYYAAKSLSILTGRWRTFRRLNFRIRLSNYFAEYRGTVYTDLIYFCGSPAAQAETGKISYGVSEIRIWFLKHRVASGDTFLRAAAGFREFIRNDSGTSYQTFYMCIPYIEHAYFMLLNIKISNNNIKKIYWKSQIFNEWIWR